MSAPIIGLTTYGRNENDFRTTHYTEWFAIPTFYVDAVRRAGGFPILLPPGEKEWDAALEIVDAVIVIGGGDIHPDNYGGNSAHPLLRRIDPERDASELALVNELVNEKQLPTLCICRGMQLANVVQGGTLHEDLQDFVQEDIHRSSDKGWTVQPIKADPRSLLASSMGVPDAATYSGHHQAVKDLGKGLQVTATAPDGIIEAVELPAHPWFVAVQWHPEITAATDPSQQGLFDALVKMARDNKSASRHRNINGTPFTFGLAMDTAIIWRQFGAAIDMLENALRACPDQLWNAPLWSDPAQRSEFAEFWYIAYHALFWLDLYLSGSTEGFVPPAPFTLDELEAGLLPERRFNKEELLSYLDHGRRKCRAEIETLTVEKANRRCKFPWGEVGYAELLLDNMRHIQEHGAQLNLFLGQQTGSAARWIAQTKNNTGNKVPAGASNVPG